METQTKKISLDKILDPKVSMRSDFDGPELEELMASMRANGLIEPIVVRPIGDHYEIIAGARRARAAKLMGWPLIEAVIKEVDDATAMAMRIAENLDRENVDPVDEACFIAEAMSLYNWTENDMVEKCKRSKTWVEERLEIFSFPDYLKLYVKQKRIGLGAGLWINRINHEGKKKAIADWAALNGVSVSAAKRYCEIKNSESDVYNPNEVIFVDPQTKIQVARKVVPCGLCKKDVYLDEAQTIWIHPNCDNLG